MKVLMVHNYYQQPGGEDVVFAAETALLRRHGHEVIEYTEHNRRIDEVSRLAAAANTIWSQSSYDRIMSVLRKTRPHVAHFHNTFLLISPAAYDACREMGVPVVQTLHNYRLLCPKATFYRTGHVCEACLGKTPPWPGVFYGCYRESRMQTAVVAVMLTLHRVRKTWKQQVDRYIALTPFARRKFIEGGFPAEKIAIKPNFIYPDPGTKEQLGDYALSIGRLVSEKGVYALLYAWQHLKQVPLKIAGDGPERDSLLSIKEMHELDHVEFLGYCSHEKVLELMKAARFVVFNSECYEGFPVTIAEAFACGTPVISSRLGGMEDIVTDMQTGLLVQPGDIADLIAKVEWAWSHPTEMGRMSRQARIEYETKYTAKQNYELLYDIYTSVLD